MLSGRRAGVRTRIVSIIFFFFNDTATTEIYTLSLHDALPIYPRVHGLAMDADELCGPALGQALPLDQEQSPAPRPLLRRPDRKSTRLNSSHANNSYAVFCL